MSFTANLVLGNDRILCSNLIRHEWAMRDLNPRLLPCEDSALTN